ncbi:MAG TPA: hypothetical protein VLQ78_06690 [Ornithinibacter sp.]|nr:hypothetical protein [Ornithinibacter sp.]
MLARHLHETPVLRVVGAEHRPAEQREAARPQTFLGQNGRLEQASVALGVGRHRRRDHGPAQFHVGAGPIPEDWRGFCLLGRGQLLWDGQEGLEARYAVQSVPGDCGVTHLVFTRR